MQIRFLGQFPSVFLSLHSNFLNKEIFICTFVLSMLAHESFIAVFFTGIRMKLTRQAFLGLLLQLNLPCLMLMPELMRRSVREVSSIQCKDSVKFYIQYWQKCIRTNEIFPIKFQIMDKQHFGIKILPRRHPELTMGEYTYWVGLHMRNGMGDGEIRGKRTCTVNRGLNT